MKTKIAYIGYKVQEKYTQGVSNDEDTELLNFLSQKGLYLDFVVWNDPKIEWTNYDLVLIKSPWDYHEDILSFRQWLEKIKKLGLKMLNPIETVLWNTDKHYLSDIAKANLPVIPSIYLDKNSKIPIDNSIFKQFNTEKLVLKPCVSAGAKNTLIVESHTLEEQSTVINSLLTAEDYILQPFVKEIVNGEWSFVFFNGLYSHSVLKVPKQGDFRVQHYLGGEIQYPEPNKKHIQQTEQFVSEFAKGTLYARVDGVIKEDTFYLMELELIEPYLFLNSKPERMERYYTALKHLL